MSYERYAKKATKREWAKHQRPDGKKFSRKKTRVLLRKRTETERNDQ